jgi:hypothetical protein
LQVYGANHEYGPAAGLAVIQSLRKDCDAKEIDIALLRDELMRIGQILEYPNMRQTYPGQGGKIILRSKQLIILLSLLQEQY